MPQRCSSRLQPNMHGFEHVTSSPRYPQSKNEDQHMALLILRSTPLENGFSPAELLMNRKVRTTLSMTETQLLPSIPDRETVQRREEQLKRKMKENFDKHHKVVTLPSLKKVDEVWIPEFETSGTVMGETHPRSYRVQTPRGALRRNCRDLISLPNTGDSQDEQTSENTESRSQRESDGRVIRSGRVSKAPDRLMTVSNN